MVYVLASRQEFDMKLVFKGNNQSRWAHLVPKIKEVEEETRRPAEHWDEQVSAREIFIASESWCSEVRQRELRIGSS